MQQEDCMISKGKPHERARHMPRHTQRRLRRARPTVHRLTTRVSSLRNCRRYLAISAAIPFGSLMLFLRSSFKTPRRPSFHCCFSCDVLPGLAVPSWTSSCSPKCAQVSLRTMVGTIHVMKLFLRRTADVDDPEVLVGAFRVIAGTTGGFVMTERFCIVDLVAECGRHEATSYILRKVGMIAVGLEHAQRALVRGEFDLLFVLGCIAHLNRCQLLELATLRKRRNTHSCRINFWLQVRS